jgi:hypothetical protein
VAKERPVKMQMQIGNLAAIEQLEDRTDEQLISESKHRAAARAILGARAAERYDPEVARKYFNEALAGCHPRERPALRQMMKASLALAERRPSELKEAVEKLGQEAPSRGQLMLLGLTGLIAPPPGAGVLKRIQGFVLLFLILVALVAVGFGIAELLALPFGGISVGGAVLLGIVIVVIAIAVLAFIGRRRQRNAQAERRGGG